MYKNIRIIAFYLPQFHPFQDNDDWWGKGFTEWTNVGKAKSLFRGHEQPKVPADLGYYDLRLPIIREQQAELAKEAGVHGFCYWHYWFGNGKRLMADIFDEVVESKSPDFPFCLAWANHSWYAKNWNSQHVKGPDKLLIEQKYPGKDDYIEHFYALLKAFKDSRYIKVDGKPLFFIYDANKLPEGFIHLWNDLAKKNGFENGICFVCRLAYKSDSQYFLDKGFSFVTAERMSAYYYDRSNNIKLWYRLKGFLLHRPYLCCNYKDAYPYFTNRKEDSNENYIPCIIPNWDHTPRSGFNGSLLINSTPKLFKEHVKDVLATIKEKKEEHQLVFLKSWNEWAEGNYMEPDLKWGKGYIEALRESLDSFHYENKIK